MKAEIKNDKIQFGLLEFIESLSGEDRNALARQLAFDEFLMQAICELVATGQCFDGWWSISSLSIRGDLEDKLRERLLPLMPEAARRQVKRLLARCIYFERENNRISEAAWRLWHDCREYAGRPYNWSPPFEKAPEPTAEQVADILKEAGF